MWYITRQSQPYYNMHVVDRIWSGHTYELGRMRLISILEEFLALAKESDKFMGPEGPESFTRGDISDIKDDLIVVKNSSPGTPLKVMLCGWKFVLWSSNDKAYASSPGYL